MKRKLIVILAISTLLLAGCAAYRVSSNIDTPNTAASLPPDQEVIIATDSLPDKKYNEISEVQVTIKKATIFHANPTEEQANEALKEKARLIGANAVIDVKYESGTSFTSWGYIEAKGKGVKFVD